jgi:cadmium resistance protein CadD (predicted permease)
MPEALTLVVVGVSLFVTTNIDDLVILVAFFAAPAFRPRQVVIGQLLGMAALIAASAVGALAALVAPERYLGLLGVVPLGLGVAKLIASIRGRGQEEDDVVSAPGAATGALAVAGVTIANGADNLAVYVPVFATHTPAAGRGLRCGATPVAPCPSCSSASGSTSW